MIEHWPVHCKFCLFNGSNQAPSFEPITIDLLGMGAALREDVVTFNDIESPDIFERRALRFSVSSPERISHLLDIPIDVNFLPATPNPNFLNASRPTFCQSDYALKSQPWYIVNLYLDPQGIAKNAKIVFVLAHRDFICASLNKFDSSQGGRCWHATKALRSID